MLLNNPNGSLPPAAVRSCSIVQHNTHLQSLSSAHSYWCIAHGMFQYGIKLRTKITYQICCSMEGGYTVFKIGCCVPFTQASVVMMCADRSAT